MPRDVKVREGNYTGDVAYLSRLSRAIEKDLKLKPKEREKVGAMVYNLMVELIKLTHGRNGKV